MYPAALMAVMLLGGETERLEPLERVMKVFSAAARIDVNVNVQMSPRQQKRKLDPKYSITDKKVITQLAKLLDVKSEASLLKGKFAQSTYVSVKLFAKKNDKEPTIRLTLLPKGVIVVALDGRTYETKQPNNELFRRLAKRDFKFVIADRKVTNTSQTSK